MIDCLQSAEEEAETGSISIPVTPEGSIHAAICPQSSTEESDGDNEGDDDALSDPIADDAITCESVMCQRFVSDLFRILASRMSQFHQSNEHMITT